MKLITLFLAGCAAFLAGCASHHRSISNSGPAFDPGQRGYIQMTAPGTPGDYQGELSEFDLLGVNRDQFVTDEQITNALAGAREVRLAKGSSILLIQSGAMFPDGGMVQELEQHFRVVPFSGVPTSRMQSVGSNTDQPAYARTFRLAAAQAGAEHIVCYWGSLESMRTDMNTKTVSWIPLAGWVIPDENQAMRIRLKLAVIDVRTGSWTMIAPESFADRNSRSNRFNRERADQKQVEELKQLAYVQGVEHLVGTLAQ